MLESQKEGRYQRVIQQLEELLTKSFDPVARMATINAVLSHKFDYYFWCGFYFVQDDYLLVGPYQGPLACQILRGSGVCITAVNQKQSVVVPDVHQFEGHIACDSRSNSEIVVPVFDQFKQIKAVLDIDSISFNSFTQTDRQYLELIADMVYVNKE